MIFKDVQVEEAIKEIESRGKIGNLVGYIQIEYTKEKVTIEETIHVMSIWPKHQQNESYWFIRVQIHGFMTVVAPKDLRRKIVDKHAKIIKNEIELKHWKKIKNQIIAEIL